MKEAEDNNKFTYIYKPLCNEAITKYSCVYSFIFIHSISIENK